MNYCRDRNVKFDMDAVYCMHDQSLNEEEKKN